MSAAQRQRQASAEQDADPQIAIHYQYDAWLIPKEKLCTTWFLWAWYWKRSHVTKTFDLVPCFFFRKCYIAYESVQTFFPSHLLLGNLFWIVLKARWVILAVLKKSRTIAIFLSFLTHLVMLASSQGTKEHALLKLFNNNNNLATAHNYYELKINVP